MLYSFALLVTRLLELNSFDQSDHSDLVEFCLALTSVTSGNHNITWHQCRCCNESKGVSNCTGIQNDMKISRHSMCWYVLLPHELHLLIVTPTASLLKVEKNGDIDI